MSQLNEDASVAQWYGLGTLNPRTCSIVFIFVHGNRPSLEPASRFSFSFLQSCHFLPILRFWWLTMLHQNIPQSKDVESILRTAVLVEPTNLSCQFVGIVCARAMHSTTKIRNDVSEQVCHSYRCPTRWYEPFGESLSRLTIDGNTMSEFTLLN